MQQPHPFTQTRTHPFTQTRTHLRTEQRTRDRDNKGHRILFRLLWALSYVQLNCVQEYWKLKNSHVSSK
jgi:hypothetical protein